MHPHVRVQRHGRGSNALAKQLEGIRAVDHFDVMAALGQRVRQVREEDGVASEMQRREERREEAESHFDQSVSTQSPPNSQPANSPRLHDAK